MNKKQNVFGKTRFGFMKKSVFPQKGKKTFEGDSQLQATHESNWSSKWQISFTNHTGQRFTHYAKTGHYSLFINKARTAIVWVLGVTRYYWQIRAAV